MADVDPFPLRFEYSGARLKFHSPQHRAAGGGVFPGDRSSVSIRSVRLLCQGCVHPTADVAHPFECLIDTGAPISVFPRKVWSSWPKVSSPWPEGPVKWHEPSDEKARRAIGVRGISVDVAPARLGRVTISLRNGDPKWPPSVIETDRFDIFAKFMTTDSPFDRVVFGMAGNAMDRWRRLGIDFQFEAAKLL